ncbi:MAG: YigZ family protein [Lachnospiraceae bacterium]|nr:YigZ family protein [Lachnospiraceae bacterium]
MNNDATSYLTVNDITEAEITEKKSRFIATVLHIESEEEATAILADFRKRYWDARHNCYAYVLGKKSELERFSDDGEPSGTAGRPILEVIKGRGLTNTMIIVTRYFGGVLLGTGGLVRAYTDSSALAVDTAKEEGRLVNMRLLLKADIKADYTLSGKVQYTLAGMDVKVFDTIYEDSVIFKVGIPADEADKVLDKITDVTNAKVLIERGETEYFALTT